MTKPSGSEPLGRHVESHMERHTLFIVFPALLMTLNSIAIDIMLPAFPQIASSYKLLDKDDCQLIIFTYLFGLGFGQLVFGPVSDHLGRRGPVLVGLLLYIVSAVIAAFTHVFTVLLAARFLQGFGAAATRVISLAIVRDKYRGSDMASIISIVMMIFLIAPVVAPLIGQTLMLATSWRMLFVFMATFSLIIAVCVYFYLPETLPQERRLPFTITEVFKAFILTLSNRVTLFYSIAMICTYGTLYSFLSTAQAIFVDIYKVGLWFPAVFAAIAILQGLGSLVNSRVVRRVGQKRSSHAALIAFVLITILLSCLSTTLSRSGLLPFFVFSSLFAIAMALFAIVAANFSSIAVEPLGAVAGTASSVIGFAQTVGGAFVGSLIGLAYNGTVTPLVVGDAMAAFIALLAVLIAEKGRILREHS